MTAPLSPHCRTCGRKLQRTALPCRNCAGRGTVGRLFWKKSCPSCEGSGRRMAFTCTNNHSQTVTYSRRRLPLPKGRRLVTQRHRLTSPRLQTCSVCHGSGSSTHAGQPVPCPACRRRAFGKAMKKVGPPPWWRGPQGWPGR